MKEDFKSFLIIPKFEGFNNGHRGNSTGEKTSEDDI